MPFVKSNSLTVQHASTVTHNQTGKDRVSYMHDRDFRQKYTVCISVCVDSENVLAVNLIKCIHVLRSTSSV